jgi:hypothetical protein
LRCEKGDIVAVRQRAGSASVAQVAGRSAAAFAAVLITMSIWWPAGIAVALLACGAATVLANRMLQARAAPAEVAEVDLSSLFPPLLPDEAVRA